jgi:hypothetical protein
MTIPGGASNITLRTRFGLLPRSELIDHLMRGHATRTQRFVVFGT